MDRERQRAKEMVKNLSFKEKLGHFWYYYKKHVIVCVIAALLVGWTIWQKATEVKYDLQIPYYSSRAIDPECLANFEKIVKEVTVDSNNNGSVDVAVLGNAADLSQRQNDQMAGAMLNKLDMTLAADEYPMYILDEEYLDVIADSYPDVIKSTVEISNIPEIREILGLYDSEKAYLVTLNLFDRLKDDEAKVAEHNNALGIEKYFADKLN